MSESKPDCQSSDLSLPRSASASRQRKQTQFCLCCQNRFSWFVCFVSRFRWRAVVSDASDFIVTESRKEFRPMTKCPSECLLLNFVYWVWCLSLVGLMFWYWLVWCRWSSRAIKSFAMGELEARKLKYPTTGTEAILMGILIEGKCYISFMLLLFITEMVSC